MCDRILGMRIVKQSFYDDFNCIADKCPDTCCQGWEIDIDEDTLKYYAEYEGPLKERINKCVDFDKSCFRITKEMRCTMLTEEGLCHLVLNHGEESLCDTCHMFPRHVEEYDGVREWSMTISCPEACMTTITATEPASFVVEENDEEEPLYDDFDDFDYLLYTALEDSRDLIYSVLHNRDFGINERMDVILSLSHKMQSMVDDNDICDIEDMLAAYKDIPSVIDPDSPGELFDKYLYVKEHSDVLWKFEHLRVAWSEVLDDLAKFNKLTKEELKLAFDCVGDGIKPYEREIILENLLTYFIYIYYLGAVYDDAIHAKTAMCLWCTVMIDYLFVCEVHMGKLTADMQGYMNIAYRFAREIEHSDINLDMIEDYCADLF